MSKWNENEAAMPDHVKEELATMLHEEVGDFWLIHLVGPVSHYRVTIKDEGVGKYSVVLFDEFRDDTIAKFVGTEDEVQEIIDFTIEKCALVGMSPVPLKVESK